MASINIRRDNKDPFYRYKMPPIVSKVEGRGNGIKTAVVNCSDVARALDRPPSYVIKFFGSELGAQTQMNETDDRYIVNGVHEASKLQDSLDGFINRFVLCGSCHSPETDILVLKDGNLTRDCKACGSRTLIDPRHKLVTYILKNPPAKSKSKRGATASANTSVGGAMGEDGSGAGEDGGDGAGNDDAANGHGDSDNDELAKRLNAEAAAMGGADGVGEDSDDENWTVDVSEEAMKARQKELEGLKISDTTGAGESEGDSKALGEFGEWVVEHVGSESDVEIYKKAVSLGIAQDDKTVQVLAQTLFTPDNIIEEIGQHAGLLGKVVASDKHERALLGGIERFVGLQHPELIKKIPQILHKLYDNDILSEEEIMHFGSKVSKKYVDKETSKKVRKAAKPFLQWLEEAESDEESDEESDDE